MINSFILPEGKRYILISFIATIIAWFFICDTLAFLLFLLTLGFIYVYRNNEVTKAKVENYVSPIDGEVFAIDKKSKKTNIYVNVSLCNSHSVIAPINCKYKVKSLVHGLNLSGFTFKSKLLNTKKVVKFDKLKLELISGRFNIEHDFKASKEVEQYEKVGIFLNGVAIISVPKDVILNIKLQDKIKAGQVL